MNYYSSLENEMLGGSKRPLSDLDRNLVSLFDCLLLPRTRISLYLSILVLGMGARSLLV